jgi:hypothetical protein
MINWKGIHGSNSAAGRSVGSQSMGHLSLASVYYCWAGLNLVLLFTLRMNELGVGLNWSIHHDRQWSSSYPIYTVVPESCLKRQCAAKPGKKLRQNYCVFGLCPSPGILETRKHNVSETGSVSVLRWNGETPFLLGLLERANLSHWTTPVRFATAV